MEDSEKDIKVRVFKCICGKARLVSVIDPNRKISKESKKEQSELVQAGCEVVNVDLETARKMELCFTCKL